MVFPLLLQGLPGGPCPKTIYCRRLSKELRSRGHKQAVINSNVLDPRQPGTAAHSHGSYPVAKYATTVLVPITAPAPITATAHPGFTVPLSDLPMRGPNTRGINEIWRQLNPNTRAKKLSLDKVIP
jgi:hypothetical protein